MKASNVTCSSKELAKWVKDEMMLPSANQFEVKQLCKNLIPACKGSTMLTLWKQVTYQVKPKVQAEWIRRNIELDELSAESEEQSSEVEEKTRVSEALKKDTESLQLQLRKHEEDLQESRLHVMNAEQSKRLVEMKSCMYRNHCEYLQFKSTVLKSFSHWFLELCAAYHKNSESTKRSEGLVTECRESVEGVCHLIGEENQTGGKQAGSAWNSAETYTSMGELVKTYPPKLIVEALEKLSEFSTLSLREGEKEIPFLNDLKKLEAQYINIDSDKDGVSKFARVQSMLEQWDLEYANSFTQCQICKRNADSMLLQMEQERNLIASHLQKQYEFEPSNLQLAIDQLDTEVQLSSAQACLRSFQSSTARLQHGIHLKTQARDQLFAVKKKIEGFSDTLTGNQSSILAITKHNSAIKSKMKIRQMQVLNVAQRKVCEKRPELLKSCVDLQASLLNRLSAFSHVDPSKLWRMRIQEETLSPVRQLSIHRFLDVSQESGKMSYQNAVQTLGLHSNISPSAIIKRIIDAEKEISTAKRLERISVDADCSRNSLKAVLELTAEGHMVEKRQTETIPMKYKDGMKVVESALKHCQNLQCMIETWYEQPAQYQTPWLTAEGLTLKEWKSKIENP